MNQWVAALMLVFIVVSAVAAGVFAAYWAITGILYAFRYQSQRHLGRASAVLVPSETHAGGD